MKTFFECQTRIMSQDPFQQIFQQLALEQEALISEEKILNAIADRVATLIYQSPDQLFSLLYRLDISEKKIKQVMDSEDDVSKKIAFLIYERQLEKIKSRKENKAAAPDDDLAW